MLTAYADVPTTVDAINKGEVFRFLTKPWNDEELKETILGALEYTDLKRRNEELSKVIWGKNRELNALNKSLEQNVRQRTEQLEEANNHLKLMNEVLKSARKAGCRRMWLITTNDNLDAIRFYQCRGLTIAAIYVDVLKNSRRLKPTTPRFGQHGIPLRDEIEFELRL